ncbi:MAG: disulfide bond formation protein B [Azonexus sp.]|nr:disulfide bond formation protein B [Azonexus sp.]
MNWKHIPARAWFAALSLACLGVTAFGISLQHLLHLSPCPYCIFQRLLYLVIAGLAFLGFLLPAGRLLWSGLIALAALGGLGVATYQSWMQAYPELAPACGFSNPDVIERFVDVLGMQWPSLFLATGFCSSKEWVFLDLSIANWSVLLFAGILGLAVLLMRKGFCGR